MQGRVVGKDSAIDTSRSLGDFDFKLPENQARADFISSAPYLYNIYKYKIIILIREDMYQSL